MGPGVPVGLAAQSSGSTVQHVVRLQRAVLTVAALGSALAGAQLTHSVLEPDTRIPKTSLRRRLEVSHT